MEKEDFHKDEFYDAYVLGRLYADDEDLFEEHLLFCEHCRKEIEVREVSVAGSVSREEIPASQDFVPDTSTDSNSEFQSEAEQQSELLLAEAFRPSPIFENAIENQVRSSGFTVLAPDDSQKFKTGDTIEFQWKNSNKQLTLVIFNNKGKIILESIVESPFKLEKKLPPGLYYWQLETDEEAIQTSKFIVQEAE